MRYVLSRKWRYALTSPNLPECEVTIERPVGDEVESDLFRISGHLFQDLLMFAAPMSILDVLAAAELKPGSGTSLAECIERAVRVGCLVEENQCESEPTSATVMTWQRKKSEKVFVIFAGVLGGVHLSPLEFLQKSRLLDHNVVLLRDPFRVSYAAGISPDCPTFSALMGWVRAHSESLSDNVEINVVGNSMGANAAILAGHYLRARTVFAFGATKTAIRGERFCAKTNWDLTQALSEHNGITEYRLFYCSGHEPDQSVAAKLSPLAGVRLCPQPGNDHAVIPEMLKAGSLDRVFHDGL